MPRGFTQPPSEIQRGALAEFYTQVYGAHVFLEGMSANFGGIAGEGAFHENRVAKQVGRRHWCDQVCLGERLAEFALDSIRIGRCNSNWNRIDIVKGYAIRANLAQQVDKICWGFGLAHLAPKGVTTDRANRSQAKSKLTFRFRGVGRQVNTALLSFQKVG